jgi:hypothetical protein
LIVLKHAKHTVPRDLCTCSFLWLEHSSSVVLQVWSPNQQHHLGIDSILCLLVYFFLTLSCSRRKTSKGP